MPVGDQGGDSFGAASTSGGLVLNNARTHWRARGTEMGFVLFTQAASQLLGER